MSILALAPANRPASAEPTSLLKLVAGEFAPRLATMWAPPHAPFLLAAAPRRHLVCLALALGRELAALGELLLHAAPKRALRAVLPDAPPGLSRALTRLGETAWSGEDYRRLVALLLHPVAGKRLRHAPQISANIVRRMASMPPPMAGAFELAWELSDDGLALLHEAYGALRARVGRAEAEAVAARWAKARSAKALFEATVEDLCAEPAPSALRGTDRLRPLTTKAAIRSAAKRFGNCLASQLPYAATGQSVFFEWTEGPGAVVEVTRCHVFGWRLEEARGPQNAPVGEAARGEILADLALMGVHVGRSGWQLEHALGSAGDPDFRMTDADPLAQLFGG
jgi:hypothetical protein